MVNRRGDDGVPKPLSRGGLFVYIMCFMEVLIRFCGWPGFLYIVVCQ